MKTLTHKTYRLETSGGELVGEFSQHDIRAAVESISPDSQWGWRDNHDGSLSAVYDYVEFAKAFLID